MAMFVLVHGAWSGSYRWRKIRPLLWSKGHEVYTPSLTGLGERRHLAGPHVNLSTHIEDVANVFFFEDLSGVVLLGHSYGGMVVTGVADRLPERIAHLVYLDAFLPNDGDSLYSLGGSRAPQTEDPSAGSGQGWQVPPIQRRFATPEEQAWNEARRGPQSRACFEELARLKVPLEERPFTRTYIKATGDPRPADGRRSGFWEAADRTRNDPRWRYREIDCGHMVPDERPAELVALLLELA